MTRRGGGNSNPARAEPYASVFSSPHLVWTVLAGGLLVLGGVLEAALAQAHRIQVESLGTHWDSSMVVPGLILGAAATCGIWPVARGTGLALSQARIPWSFAVIAVVGVAFWFGHMFEGAAVAFASSVWLTMARRGASR